MLNRAKSLAGLSGKGRNIYFGGAGRCGILLITVKFGVRDDFKKVPYDKTTQDDASWVNRRVQTAVLMLMVSLIPAVLLECKHVMQHTFCNTRSATHVMQHTFCNARYATHVLQHNILCTFQVSCQAGFSAPGHRVRVLTHSLPARQ